MHKINNLFHGGRGRPTFSGDYGYQSKGSNGAEASSYSFSSKAFGPAHPTRLVIVVVHYADVSGNPDISSVKIGGVTATEHTNIRPDSGPNKIIGQAIYSAAVPTGTSGTIVVNLNQTISNCQVSVYSVIGLDSVTPVYAGATNADNSSSRNRTATPQPDGILIAGSSTNPVNRSCAWTNAVEDHDSEGDDSYSSAHIERTNGGDITITANWGSSSAMALAVAAWR